MNQFERRELKQQAQQTIAGASCRPGRLVLIHTALSSGLTLLLALVSLLLDQKIAGTTGLGGMNSRAFLETIQSVLNMATLVVLPFWGMGLVFVFLRISRYEGAQPQDLLQGFRYFGPVLRGKLLQVLVIAGAAVLGGYLGMFVYSMTPLSSSLYTVMEQHMVDGVLDYAAAMEDPVFLEAAIWSLPIMMLGAAVFVLPLYYRLRLMDYILMDRPEKGAMYAMRFSKYVMRGHRWELFRVDLHFWWFYLLEALVLLVGYGDMILPMINVDLGVSQTVAFFLFYILALVGQLCLYVWKRPLLLAVYARYYDMVRPKPQMDEDAQEVSYEM